jgi:hypothetical protein
MTVGGELKLAGLFAAHLLVQKSNITRLEFITNLMHNFIYSIIILHHNPQHGSSNAVLIFRRTTVYLQYLQRGPLLIGALYGSIQSVTIPDTVNIQFSS